MTTAGKSSVTYLVKLTVEPLPYWVVGTFNGGSEVWQSAITVGANGKISGKYLQTFNYTFTFTSPGFDEVEYVSKDVDPEWNGWKYSAIVTAKSSAAMERYTLEIYNGPLGGKARLLDNVDYTGPLVLTSAYLFQAVDWKSEPWKSFAAAFAKVTVATDEPMHALFYALKAGRKPSAELMDQVSRDSFIHKLTYKIPLSLNG